MSIQEDIRREPTYRVSQRESLVLNQRSSLLKQSSFYFAANILINLAGLITFPVWTRVLSVEEYGIFSLTVVTMMMLGAGSKFGLQHAALRYYSESSNREDREVGLSRFYSTISAGSFIIALLVCCGFLLIFSEVGSLFTGPNMLIFLIYASALGFINSVTSVQMTFFRAKEDARIYTLVSVIKRYGDFALAWLFVVVLWNFRCLFMGWLVVDVLALIWLVCAAKKEFSFHFDQVSGGFFKEAVKYGLPLISFELCANLLSIGDRYLIDFYLGKSAVGIYSAGYNLGTYGPAFIAFPLRMAVMPRFFKAWEEGGESETRALLNRILKYYFMLAVPLAFGMIYLSKDITLVLASNKFQESSVIIPYVVISMAIWGPFFIYGAGFYIKKRNLPLAGFTFLAALTNLGLNCLLIPRFHLRGAALATLIAYLMLSFLIFGFSRKYIKISIPFFAILKSLLLSLIMVLALSLLRQRIGVFFLLEKAVIGCLIYIVGLILIDKDARNIALEFLPRQLFS